MKTFSMLQLRAISCQGSHLCTCACVENCSLVLVSMHGVQAAHAELKENVHGWHTLLQVTSKCLLQVRIRDAHVTLCAENFMKVLDKAVQQLRNSTMAE